MRRLESLWTRLRTLLFRRRERSRLHAELEFHLEQQVAENLARGMTPEQARRAAILAFGNPAAVGEATADTWSWNHLELLFRDLRIAARTLIRQPGFSLAAMVVIAIGIGAAIALITVVWSVLLKPLPFNDPARLVRLYEQSADGKFHYNVVTPGVFAAWQRDSHSFSDLAIFHQWPQYNLSDAGGPPEQVRATLCTWNLFSTLGVQPALGRAFTTADDRPTASGTVVLSWALWKRRYGGDSSIVGRTINLDSKPYTVIGVMPAWFAYPEQAVPLWLPVYHENSPEHMASIDNHQYAVVGRLNPGVTPQQAVQELSAIVRRLHDEHLDDPFVSIAANIRPMIVAMVGDITSALYILLAATGCMLLIACLNVANLLTARAAARRRELAIRIALGGGRFRLIREQLLETFALFCAGGAAGLTIAAVAVRWFVAMRGDMARAESIHIDSTVVAVVAALIVLCALFSGAVPLLANRSHDILPALQESSRSTTAGAGRVGVRRLLVAAEVAFTLVLLVTAGLLLKSYIRLRSVDLGCATDNVLTMRFTLPEARYHEPAQRVTFFDEVLARVRALPGVDAASLVRAVPGQGYYGDGGFAVAEHPPLPQGKAQFAIVRWADPGYFAALKIPLLQGRTFGPDQRLDAAHEVIVSADFARTYLPGEDPIGKHLITEGKKLYEIVGVVGATRYLLAETPEPIMYFPLDAAALSDVGAIDGVTLAVRSSRAVETLALPVQRVIQGMDHELAVADVLTMNQLIDKSAIDTSFEALLLASFAGVSLLLAAVGLFGVLAYLVAQRYTEIGIRMALGAQPGQVLRLMLLDGLRPAFAGIVFGSVAALASAQLIRSSLYGTRPVDPETFVLVITLLLAVAVAACLLPAWRASRLEPTAALRDQ